MSSVAQRGRDTAAPDSASPTLRTSAPPKPVTAVYHYHIDNDPDSWYSYLPLRRVETNINDGHLNYEISGMILKKFGIYRHTAHDNAIDVDYVVVWLHNRNKSQWETVLKAPKLSESGARNIIVALTNIDVDVKELTKPLTRRLYKLHQRDSIEIQLHGSSQKFELRLFKPELPKVYYYRTEDDKKGLFSSITSIWTKAPPTNIFNGRMNDTVAKKILQSIGVHYYEDTEHEKHADYLCVWLHNRNANQHERLLKHVASLGVRNVVVALTNTEKRKLPGTLDRLYTLKYTEESVVIYETPILKSIVLVDPNFEYDLGVQQSFTALWYQSKTGFGMRAFV